MENIIINFCIKLNNIQDIQNLDIKAPRFEDVKMDVIS